jgi:hypothetical protein
MILTSITVDDLMLLRQFRVERLVKLFAESLQGCIIFLDPYNILTINCADGKNMDSLLNELEDFCNYTWLILGIETISLNLAQKEVCHIRNCRSYSAAYRLLNMFS